MVNLRCSRCGSSEGFLIETQTGKTLEIKASLTTDRILKTVRVTCVYCNHHWDHVPIKLRDTSALDPFRRRVMH